MTCKPTFKPYDQDFRVLQYIKDHGPAKLHDLPGGCEQGGLMRSLRAAKLTSSNHVGYIITDRGIAYLAKKEDVMKTRVIHTRTSTDNPDQKIPTRSSKNTGGRNTTT